MLFIFSGLLWGAMLSPLMPWAPEDMLPFQLSHYLQPFVLIVLTNVFFTGSLFFMSGSLTKRPLLVYIQGILLLGLYEMLDGLANNVETKELATLIDPLLLLSIFIKTQYWTIAEQNTQLISFTGAIAINRIIWLLLGGLVLLFTFWRFEFKLGRKERKQDRKREGLTPPLEEGIVIPPLSPLLQTKTFIAQTLRQSFFYARMIVQDRPFITIVFAIALMFGFVSMDIGREYGGSNTYLTTYVLLEAINGFYIFFIVILIFYAGELMWKERDIKMHLILDSMPVPDWVDLLSKFIGLVWTLAGLMLFLIGLGAIIQLSRGFYQLEFPLYFSVLFGDLLWRLMLFTIIAFFIQVLVNHKFLGYALVILFFMVTLVIDNLGLEHDLFHYGKSHLGLYSEMNGFGHYLPAFIWFNSYWLGLAILFFVGAVLLSVRGIDTLLSSRIKLAKYRFTRPIRLFTLGGALIFLCSGSYIYYNTNILNTYENSTRQKERQASYEKDLKQYQYMTKPCITSVQLEVDIYPSSRAYDVQGHFVLSNKSETLIQEIHLLYHPDQRISFDRLDFTPSAQLKKAYEAYRYYIYELESPLYPGDTLSLAFSSTFRVLGFEEQENYRDILFNGTFFNNSHFPMLGYNAGYELIEQSDRAKYDLEPRERLLDRDDPRGLQTATHGSHIESFDITISTDSNQIALAPGYLQKEWKKEGRNVFHYTMNVPMENQYAIISANYKVLQDKVSIPIEGQTKEVDLAVYYHSGHAYNIDKMMNAMKESLHYYSKHFGPYQYRQMRILEFPRYTPFAQSFPNTVPFSEGIGFVMEIEEGDTDIPFYITAHELGHQWWGDQVTGPFVKGVGMLIETLTQYSAAMVTRNVYSEEALRPIILHELNRYLTGRKKEVLYEQPLAEVEEQEYIHYGKGLINMYALQDYISEDSVNLALRRLVRDFPSRVGRHPTTKDVINYFRAVTPDSLQFLVTDLFEKIVLFENKTVAAFYQELVDGQFEVSLEIQAQKWESDKNGISTEVDFEQWIDIGIYASNTNGKDSLIYQRKHKIITGSNKLRIRVPNRPSRAGIDPINKLIDRDPMDNVRSVIIQNGF